MKLTRALLLKILFCLTLAAGAYLWATGLIDSLYSYRSPLHYNPPTNSNPLRLPGELAPTRRVVFVLVDALRLDTALNAQVMPFLAELRELGAWATLHSRPPSYSAPSYSVLMTGAWPELSDGPAMNLAYEELTSWSQGNLFTVAHQANLQSAVSAFNWFEKLIPAGSVSASYYTSGEDQQADRAVVDAALPWLQAGGYEFVLIHLDQVDYAGHHEGGPQGIGWSEAAQRVDGLLREIAVPLDLEQDTLLVTSDHGQIDAGGHGGHDPVTLLEPFVLAGAGVKPGAYGDINMVDVAPTIAALLGAGLPGTSQGRVLADMLSLPAPMANRLADLEADQQAALLSAYQNAIGEAAREALLTAHTPDFSVSDAQVVLQASRLARLNRERAWRTPLALIALLLPAYLLLRLWDARLVTVLAGSLIYLAVFHTRYALLDQRTYSLSSVASPSDIILYTASTALLACLAGWFFAAWRLKIWQQRPVAAANHTLTWSLATLYLVSWPLIWSYWLNGAFITWTLPNFAAMFGGFLALLQVLTLAALCPLLAGVSALLVRSFEKRPKSGSHSAQTASR